MIVKPKQDASPMESSLEEQPNELTIAAMLEAERIARDPNAKSYSDLDELFAALRS